MSDEPGLDAAYSLDGPDDVRALYRGWADSFESGFLTESGYVYHEELVRVFSDRTHSLISADEPILDVGCGTGIGGVALRDHGAWPIDGLDLSPEMLAKAAGKSLGGKPVYRNLIEADVLQMLEIGDATYGALISVGTFTHGHVGPEALGELIRITRPGGLICIGINEEFFAHAGFDDRFAQHQKAGLISEVEMVRVRIYDATLESHPHAADTALVACFSPANAS